MDKELNNKKCVDDEGMEDMGNRKRREEREKEDYDAALLRPRKAHTLVSSIVPTPLPWPGDCGEGTDTAASLTCRHQEHSFLGGRLPPPTVLGFLRE